MIKELRRQRDWWKKQTFPKGNIAKIAQLDAQIENILAESRAAKPLEDQIEVNKSFIVRTEKAVAEIDEHVKK